MTATATPNKVRLAKYLNDNAGAGLTEKQVRRLNERGGNFNVGYQEFSDPAEVAMAYQHLSFLTNDELKHLASIPGEHEYKYQVGDDDNVGSFRSRIRRVVTAAGRTGSTRTDHGVFYLSIR